MSKPLTLTYCYCRLPVALLAVLLGLWLCTHPPTIIVSILHRAFLG